METEFTRAAVLPLNNLPKPTRTGFRISFPATPLPFFQLVSDLVFKSKTGTPIESGHLRRVFRLALKKAEIEDFHFHDLRHTFATRLVQAGVELYKVQRLLGHKSPLMTQRYAHHYPESLRDGVEILDRITPTSQFITVGTIGSQAQAVSG